MECSYAEILSHQHTLMLIYLLVRVNIDRYTRDNALREARDNTFCDEDANDCATVCNPSSREFFPSQWERPTFALMVCPTLRIIQGNHYQQWLVTVVKSRVFENLIDGMHYWAESQSRTIRFRTWRLEFNRMACTTRDEILSMRPSRLAAAAMPLNR